MHNNNISNIYIIHIILKFYSINNINIRISLTTSCIDPFKIASLTNLNLYMSTLFHQLAKISKLLIYVMSK